jgi:desampylase
MIMDSVTIPARIVAGLRRQAVVAAEAECCGALTGLGRGRVINVRGMIPADNTADRPRRYHIDADTVLRLERQASCAELHVVGFYHSHPGACATPSATDLELACPGYLYLIVETETGVVRAWRLRDDRAGFDEVVVVPLEGAA